mgnify:CR=1 FL=1
MRNISKQWFTLIEILVSISILWMIMVSVFTIFILAADLNNKTDISRAMQENTKNFVEVISNDIRENGVTGVNSDIVISNCKLDQSVKYLSGNKLCVGGNSYYLAKKVAWVFNRIGNESDCETTGDECFLVKNDGTTITQLNNSWVEFRKLSFYVTSKGTKKVHINFEMQPSIKKWVKTNLIKENNTDLEETLSDYYKDETAYKNIINILPIDDSVKYESGLTLFKHKIPMWIFLISLIAFVVWSWRKNLSLIPLLGLVSCLYMMAELSVWNWIYFTIWLLIGLVIYFGFSYKNSKLNLEQN